MHLKEASSIESARYVTILANDNRYIYKYRKWEYLKEKQRNKIARNREIKTLETVLNK